ncbi:hypothetical protein GCM10022206_31860 [Streptomyces chiangmaiensis]
MAGHLGLAGETHHEGAAAGRALVGDVTFPLLCEQGKVLPTMNEIRMSKDRSTSSLQFTAEPSVTWSFAVGWDPSPPEQQ